MGKNMYAEQIERFFSTMYSAIGNQKSMVFKCVLKSL